MTQADLDRVDQLVKDLLAHDRQAQFDHGARYALETCLTSGVVNPTLPMVLLEAFRVLKQMPMRASRITDPASRTIIMAVRFETDDELKAFERVTNPYLGKVTK